MSQKQTHSAKKRRAEYRARRKRRGTYITLGIVGTLVVIAFLIVIVLQQPAVTVNDAMIPEAVDGRLDTDSKAWGPADAPVIIEEFSDFQCPYCGQFATSTGQQLKETYGGSGVVRFEYNHFAFLGPESEQAAEAAECAREQGKFWQYHDTLFANQQGENRGAFADDTLKAFAAELGLDKVAFNQCLDSGQYEEKVRAETIAAQERGVRSTPTLFINGEKIEGAVPFAQLQPVIEAALADTRAEE